MVEGLEAPPGPTVPAPAGQHCTEDVDECQLMPNACQNGGTCHNAHGGYNCVCVNGWTGEDCSENIDDCASASCFHGATCHDRVASFYCECPHGRTGERRRGGFSLPSPGGGPPRVRARVRALAQTHGLQLCGACEGDPKRGLSGVKGLAGLGHCLRSGPLAVNFPE